MVERASNADRAKYLLRTSPSARQRNDQTITIYKGDVGQFYFGDTPEKAGQHSIGVDRRSVIAVRVSYVGYDPNSCLIPGEQYRACLHGESPRCALRFSL